MKKISQHKENGATFTPKSLADYLAAEIIAEFPVYEGKEITALDPACGDGELLLALGRAIQNQGNNTFSLTGYDLNSDYVRQSQNRLNESGIRSANIQVADFLTENTTHKPDVIIANPPYVRTQILGGDKAKMLAQKYNLKGRVDLYYPFLIEMTHALKEGGILGVITSNRYLFTKSGESIREFLFKHYEVLKVIDLGDTKIFENAAVLPAIFIGRKKKVTSMSIKGSTFLKVYAESNPITTTAEIARSIFDVLHSRKSGLFKVNGKYFRKTKGELICHQNDNAWHLLSDEEQEWIKKINAASRYRVKDLAKVRVGVKTTADNVFIRGDWEKLEVHKQPEGEVLRSLISPKNIQKWCVPFSSNYKILYTHTMKAGKRVPIDLEFYPKAAAYLNSHKAQLSSRSYVIEAKRNWFEIWVPQQPRLWPKVKLVFPDISEGPRFYLDTEGTVVDGNCYWISVEDTGNVDTLLLIQGVANSKLMARYHDLCFNNRLFAGRRRYLTQYVENYPLPDLSNPVAKDIIAIVRELNNASKKSLKLESLERQLDQLVKEVFGVEDAPFPMEED